MDFFQGTLGRYGTNYMPRAVTARIAIGANPAEDAVYINSSADSEGQPFIGSTRYRMHFEASSLPPVLAFWSVTAYDKDGYFIANPIGRYAVGDRDPLKFIQTYRSTYTFRTRTPDRIDIRTGCHPAMEPSI